MASGSTYEVDGDGVVARQVRPAVDGQEREALALRGELAGELLGRHSLQVWHTTRDLTHLLVVVLHIAHFLVIIDISIVAIAVPVAAIGYL